MVKMYDGLMKSGNFTAAQNKAANGEFVDSIGELVVLCETEGFIPRYYIGEPNDMVDETIKDMQLYTRTLITEETNLGDLVELAIKNNEKEDKEAEEADDTEEVLDDDVMEIENELNSELNDEDFEDYNDFVEGQELLDYLEKEEEY